MEKSINTLSEKNSLPMSESEKRADEYPVLTLAYMGDAVMELFARDYVLRNSGQVKPAALVFASKAIITCEAQSDAVEKILPCLTDKEMSVYKCGRNAKTRHTPKHGELIQYKRATGFEALMGYLYVSQNTSRAKELFDIAFCDNENKE